MRTIIRVFHRIQTELYVRSLRRRGVTIGSGVRFTGKPIVDAAKSQRVIIGNDVRLISSNRFATLGVRTPCIIRTMAENAEIEIGSDVGMTGAVICAARSIRIGKGTLIGADVIIADTDFHPISSPDRRYQPIPQSQEGDEIKIGDNVFLGTRCTVLKGVTIGSNSVIGAGSMVVTNVPANSIAAGVPAKVIGQLSL